MSFKEAFENAKKDLANNGGRSFSEAPTGVYYATINNIKVDLMQNTSKVTFEYKLDRSLTDPGLDCSRLRKWSNFFLEENKMKFLLTEMTALNLSLDNIESPEDLAEKLYTVQKKQVQLEIKSSISKKDGKEYINAYIQHLIDDDQENQGEAPTGESPTFDSNEEIPF